jgi:FG-GAP repeat protein
MSLQFGKTTTNATASLRGRHFGAPLIIVALMFSTLFVPRVRATTVLDPDPENSTTLFGRAIAVIGDVNGDGVPDLAVGTPFDDGEFPGQPGKGTPQNVGKVFVINGATHAVITELKDPQFQMQQGNQFGGQLGFSVAAVGDINGDGIPDVLAGVPHHNVEVAGAKPAGVEEKIINTGRAFAYSGIDGTVLHTLDDPTEEEGAQLGYAVANAGDINSDGVNDLAVGVPLKDTPEGLTDVGLVYIYSGADGSLLRTLHHPDQGGAEVGARFGAALANAGDMNHDGVSDLIVGAPGRGEAFVVSGATGAILFTVTSPSVESLPSFGSAVAGGKDLDNDGTPDFAVGAPLLKLNQGTVFIYTGRNGTLLRRLTAPGHQTFASFGASVILTDDVTGDGRPDVVVGAPDQDLGSLRNAGEVYIFRGSNGRISTTLTSEVTQAFAGFGFALASADFSGDGIPETVVGVPFQNADLMGPDGDIVTHLQIGQIEIH